MKRKTVKVLLCAALMSLALSATACGGSDAGSDSAAPAEEAAVEEEAPEEEAPAEEEAPEEEEAAPEEAPAEEETAAPAETPAAEAPAEEEASGGAVSSGQKTLEEYLKEDPTAEQQLMDQAAAQGDDTIDMSIEVVGNEIYCVGTFKDSVEMPADAADTLNAGMSELEPAFSAIAGILDEAIGAEKGTVSYGIRYCDSDGNVLAEASFTAE